ncbi:RecX family transcriptional regulator [Bacteroidales bacterium OttesenSCG-928-A17]|nr:RecX family transcriptional regulator [Bacteroidales bacterium OttesenSCG-928-A17]
MKKLTYEQALHRMAAYCSRAERCLQDVRKKLDIWEFSSQEQSHIIQHLQKEKFLDEMRYANAFVRDKSRFNAWGIHKIRMELRRKNVPDEIIGSALAEINPEETLQRLAELLKKKSRSIKANSEWEAKQKLIRFAAGRGFSLEDIEKAMGI